MSQPSQSPAANEARVGFFYALTAYVLWGFLAFFMKAIDHIPVMEIITHRVLWSVPVALIFVLVTRRFRELVEVFSNPKTVAVLALSSIVVSSNWGVYVYAILSDQAVEAALGYYINPLITVALGMLFLGEKLSAMKWLALGLATIAVIILTINAGRLPIVALYLAASFACYGLIRKTLNVRPTLGFTVEASILSIAAIPFAIWLAAKGTAHFTSNTYDTLMLMFCGPVTAIPLILFANGARRLSMATLGLMQYIVPTMLFLIGVFIFKEPFNQVQLVAFVFIWTAVAIYSWSSLRKVHV